MKTNSFDTKANCPSEFFEWLGIPIRREGERSYRTAAFWRNDAHASVSIFYGTRQTWMFTDNSVGKSGDVFLFLKQLGLTTDDMRSALEAYESGAPVPGDVVKKIDEVCGYEVQWPAYRSGANSLGSGVRDVRRIEPTRRMLDEAQQYRGIVTLPPWLWAYNVEYVGGRVHDMWGIHRNGNYDQAELFDAAHKTAGGQKMSLGKKEPVFLGEGQRIAVVEGGWDAIAAWSMGYEKILCLFSTAMAKMAAEKLVLSRNVSEIVFMLDADDAGKEAEKTMLEYMANPYSYSPFGDGFDPETCRISTMQTALELATVKDVSDLHAALQGAQWGRSIGLEPIPIQLPEPQPQHEKHR